MVSELRTRKYTALFGCFDFDHNGILERSDYEQFSRNLAHAYHLESGTTEHGLMHAETMSLWDFIQSVADTDGDQKVDVAEFIAAYDQMTSRDDTFAQLLGGYASFVIRMGDRDKDGMLNEDEYATILWCYGIEDAAARAAFGHVVPDGGTHLSNEAMERVFAEFFRSDDSAAPGNWMIGPIE